MYSAILFFAVCLVAVPAGAFVPYRPSPVAQDSRIVGGSDAPAGSALYQASLRSVLNSHFCGGSVIGERWVLTAAHCTSGNRPASIRVIVGTHTLNRGGVSHTVQKIIVHDKYDSDLIINDISLLQLSTSIVFGNLVQPIRLPTKNTEGGADLILTGWGRISYPGGVVPNNLQTIELKALSVEDCQSRLERYNPVFSSEVCSLTKTGEGACHGDSGGPLVEKDSVVGIVSWGMPCALGYPDVYTRVYSFLDWINKHTESSA